MANNRSAEKRNTQTIKRTARNVALRSRMRTAVRKFREALTGGDASVVTEAFNVATRELRCAASKGVIHSRTASRCVSRLHLALNASNK